MSTILETSGQDHFEEAESRRLTIVYQGGLAEHGALLLEDYAASLHGWRDLFNLLGDEYLRRYPQTRGIRREKILRIEVVAERRGSWQSDLVFYLGVAAAGGIIGNRADVAFVWTYKKLIDWYRDVIRTFVRQKNLSTNIDEIAAALKALKEAADGASDSPQADDQPSLFAHSVADTASRSDQPDRSGLFAERVDQLLKDATRPLDNSCSQIELRSDDGSAVVQFGGVERDVISAPLSLPPPNLEWRRARVKFERINRKTGRALFNFDTDERDAAGRYSKIIGHAVRKPNNAFTNAFNEDAYLDVWVRETHPEPGRLNRQWLIDAVDSGDNILFPKS